MAVIDERGKLFGRVNVVDASVGLLVAVLIPMAYGAYVLFRQPEPSVVSIDPARVTQTATSRVRIIGENLRPYLRVSFNDLQGQTFALLSPSEADVVLPRDMPSGVYDVVLYDVAQEVGRIRGALTVAGAPGSGQATVLAAGVLVDLDETALAAVKAGVTFTAAGGETATVERIANARPSTRWIRAGGGLIEVPMVTGRQLPVLLKIHCTIAVQRCQFASTDLDPGQYVSFMAPDGKALRFVVQDVVADQALRPVDLLVRFAMQPEVADRIRAGDREQGSELLAERMAAIAAIRSSRRTTANMTLSNSSTVASVGQQVAVNDAVTIVDAVVHMTADQTAEGLRYRGQPLRAGEALVFQSSGYVIRGWIVRVDPAKESSVR